MFPGLLCSLPVFGLVNEMDCLCNTHISFGGGKLIPSRISEWDVLHPAHAVMGLLRK